ncbi:MAG: hypothetical protein II438_08210, partial [Clostridiales bacterium]|nr:hypothetical protein [Clostridiales bacterium]
RFALSHGYKNMGKISKLFSFKPSGRLKNPALIYAVILESILVGSIPFAFLFLKNFSELITHSIPESWYDYSGGERYVVTKKGIKFTDYYNNTTKQESDGTTLRVPPGSKLEVAIVSMRNYPNEPAYITTTFYECDSGLYTLWGGLSLDWFENADEVIQDLDALRAREAAQKREYTIRSVIGLLLTVIITGTIVFLLWKLLKKHEEFHYLFIALFVLAAAVFWVAGRM